MVISQRGIKQEIIALLGKEALAPVLAQLAAYPPEKLLNPLFSAICSTSEKTRWHAISAFGATVARLADQETEVSSAVRVAVDVLRELWLSSVLLHKLLAVTDALLEALVRDRGRRLQFTLGVGYGFRFSL